MRTVTIEQESKAELRRAEVPESVVGPGEVLIDVAASAVNRADRLQAAGMCAVPPR